MAKIYHVKIKQSISTPAKTIKTNILTPAEVIIKE